MASPTNGVARPQKPSRMAEILRESVISMFVGMGAVFLLNLERPGFFLSFRVLAYGSLLGLSVLFCCRALYRWLGGWIQRKAVLPPRVAAALIFFIGGGLGWILATLFAQSVSLLHFTFSRSELQIAFAISGSFGLVVGLLFYSFARMQDRLRESVARVKEAEFAEKELELARSIQQRLLPPTEIEGDGFRIAARNLPARFVAGDFYDVFHLADGTVGIAVADVSGKGMGASLIMASVKAMLPLVAAGRSAAETLRELNCKLSTQLEDREFVALAYARYEPQRGVFELANAGLPDPYYLGRSGSVEPLSVSGPRLPLGARPDVAYESLTLSLAAGERVLFLTDGLPEALSPSGEPLGYEALVRFLASATARPGPWLDGLLEKVRSATSSVLEDDWTVLLLENRRA